MKNILIVFLSLLGSFLGRSEPLVSPIPTEVINYDTRSDELKRFLEENHSPLAENASEFIRIGDDFGYDYRVLVAVSGVESGFGSDHLCGDFNPFGWGNPCWDFESFSEAIESVGGRLGRSNTYKKFQETGRLEDLGYTYNPSNAIEWSRKVNYFIIKIENTTLNES